MNQELLGRPANRQSAVHQLVQLAAHGKEVVGGELQHQVERAFIERGPLADFQLALDVPAPGRTQLGFELAGETGFVRQEAKAAEQGDLEPLPALVRVARGEEVDPS